MRVEVHNTDGTGYKEHRVYDMPKRNRYWISVTQVPCPCCGLGVVQWAESGFTPGYRICDTCGRHFLTGGTVDKPSLILLEGRRGIPKNL